MIESLFVILLFQLIGEIAHSVLDLPVPGPVIGMFLLAGALVIRRSRAGAAGREAATPAELDSVARSLVRHMGLLFVPAGVGVVAMAGLLRAAWLPIAVGLVGSTLLGLLATGWVMHALLAARAARAR
ncbi:putative effector of murein hydrolase LrgA (UPF0299 family) [Endobacter medicaginis]|jgi:holin-like protein|uniref:Putative effector of murein hydrolase LrgA (UPF0299 family) n=3 Tax=Endobacter medicaginis TaxID=1181271 RepID=A0A839UUV5_9PROT|nr:CidA/LrgA family protein [Endobacter medicaginis]MBB3173567.1 putative effector of murein hydrolase LrgA (UPF0299 family) [Endobacter medicaginis]MCX5475796.1 CidA/LrgA family protein [Endobacter medicaginis]